ncbi:MAG: apolipoprotein N-acyltransferase, partial [Actinomycetota bacterium]
RAIEQDRWLVQVAPTGFSAFVSPEGEVFDRTAVSERAVIVREIPLRSGRTLYSRLGDLPFIVAFVAVLVALLVSARRTRT